MSLGYDHFLDLEHDRHFNDYDICTGCADEDCSCQDLDNDDFDEPDEPDYDSCDVCFGGVDW